ncbi:restriction endonuclease subunit S [Fibrobacter succinogenes]|uniref:Type I restriction enzyme, S subunit n=1 Tax=Fibrobacter succinogenes TaxID=833 RepID=A0A380S6C5_FIBSU|nr:restriction endonuclease subunit S [Fibrobacter succinogenes]PWJ35623.1 type I restriction enzyme S subunit [Fibrobacter succinogenes subsp. elongatus]SUQ24278.1 type I restriction enzyme, S subunit [Fibrobacter succinogenes]
MDGKQLKNSILQWAIQGKLVPQNPKDEPAQKLLERIAASRNGDVSPWSEAIGSSKNSKKSLSTSLRGAKATKQSKALSSRIYRENGVWYEQVGTAAPKDISDEIPFEIPENWAWCRLGDLGLYRKGPFGSSLTKSMFVPKSDKAVKVYEQKNAIKKDYTLGDYYISPEKFNTMQSFIVRPNDIIVSCAGTIGETYMLPQDASVGIINQALMRVCLYDLEIADYWQLFFEYILLKKAEMKGAGSAIKNIPPFEVFKSLLIALPPIQEQKRLLEKYRKVLKHVEEFDEAQEQLDKLNKELPEALKKSILQEAIQGKLVPQNPKDEPAQKLLERIAASRNESSLSLPKGMSSTSLRGAKATKQSKNPPSRIYRENGVWYEQIGTATPKDISDEIPFEIPETWAWCRIKDLSTLVTKGTTPRGGNVAYTECGIGFLRAENVAGFDCLNKRSLKYVDEETHYNFLQRSILQANDILITIAGTLGRTALVRQEDLPLNANQAIALIRPIRNDEINLTYLIYALNCPEIQKCLLVQKKITAIPNLTLEIISDCLIPLPPLAEQKRIVAKLEQLFKVL